MERTTPPGRYGTTTVVDMARGARKNWDIEQLRDRYVEAALQVLQEEGRDGFTLRRVAERAGTSTMGVYTRFEGRSGLIRAVCENGLSQLRDHLLVALRYPHLSGPRGRRAQPTVPAGHEDPRPRYRERDPSERVLALALAYRDFALRHPHLHTLLSSSPADSAPGGYPKTRELCHGLITEALTGPGTARRDGPAGSDHTTEQTRTTGGSPGKAPDPADLLWACLHGMVCTELAERHGDGSCGSETDPGKERLLTGLRVMLIGLCDPEGRIYCRTL
jgi:AcrR family transcriptional regulator